MRSFGSKFSYSRRDDKWLEFAAERESPIGSTMGALRSSQVRHFKLVKSYRQLPTALGSSGARILPGVTKVRFEFLAKRADSPGDLHPKMSSKSGTWWGYNY